MEFITVTSSGFASKFTQMKYRETISSYFGNIWTDQGFRIIQQLWRIIIICTHWEGATYLIQTHPTTLLQRRTCSTLSTTYHSGSFKPPNHVHTQPTKPNPARIFMGLVPFWYFRFKTSNDAVLCKKQWPIFPHRPNALTMTFKLLLAGGCRFNKRWITVDRYITEQMTKRHNEMSFRIIQHIWRTFSSHSKSVAPWKDVCTWT